MKHASVPAVAMLMVAMMPAFAGEGHCDADLKAIDTALAKAKLSEPDMAAVKAARSKAEELHKAGKEEACEKALAGAQKLLGLEEQHK